MVAIHKDTEGGILRVCWTGHTASSWRGGVRKRDALLSMFVPFYHPRTQNWNTHFSNLAQTSIFCDLHQEGPQTHNLCSTTKCQQSSWATSRPGRKRESSVPARGKITKKTLLCGHLLTCGAWLELSSESLTSQCAMQNWKLHQITSKSQVFAGSVLRSAPLSGRNKAFSSACLNISGQVSNSNNCVTLEN